MHMIWGILSVIFSGIELVVGMRFFFLLLGANSANQFVAWVYDISTPLVAPFAGIFGVHTITAPGQVTHSVFEPSTLVALIFYGVVGGIVLRLLASSHHN